MIVESTDALICVDLQNDFFPGGPMAINEADRIVPIVNQLIMKFPHVVFTRDWHPQNHCSFTDEPEFTDMSWPEHCVANSPGAEFHGDLHIPADAMIISKATEPDAEAYSGFDGTQLAEKLRERGVERVFVCGLATDVCVKHTALDALDKGFKVVLIENACRGVNHPPGSVTNAVEEMKSAGIEVRWSGDIE